VFKALLTLIPNSEEQIMTGSEDNLAEIADSVSFVFICRSPPFESAAELMYSSAKGRPEPEAMIPNHSKAMS
jgi:hypothetical protein